MANTFVKIGSVTVGSGGSGTISFSSIPQTYTDLQLFMSLRTSNASNQDQVNVRFNGNSTAGIYSWMRLAGEGTTASTASGSGNNLEVNWAPSATQTSNTFGQHSFYIPNYTVSQNKSMSIEIVSEGNAGQVYGQVLQGALFSSTAAVTSIEIQCFGSIFVQYSTATLYGIKKS